MGGINPTDMQVTMTKSVDLARQYSQEAHKVIANQQAIAEDEERLKEENTKKVHDRNLVEKIQKDEEENKEKDRSNQEEQEKEEKEKEELEKEIKKNYPEARGHFNQTI